MNQTTATLLLILGGGLQLGSELTAHPLPQDVKSETGLVGKQQVEPSSSPEHLLSRPASGDSATAFLIDGYFQLSQNRRPQALTSFQRSFRSQPTGAALTEILRLTRKMNRRSEYIRYAKLGAGIDLVDATEAVQAALLLTDYRRYTEAVSYYRCWLQLNASMKNDYLRLLVVIETGRLEYLIGDYRAAGSRFAEVLKVIETDQLRPEQRRQLLRNSNRTYRMMARAFLKTGKLADAKRLFDKAHQQSDAATRLYDEAEWDLENGDSDSAREKIVAAISKQSQYSDYYRLLERILQADVESDKATNLFVAQLESIRQKFSTGKFLDDFLIDALLKSGNDRRALELLLERRKGTIYRDVANRKILQVALDYRDPPSFLEAFRVELDEHETLVQIRSILDKAAADPQFIQALAADRQSRTWTGKEEAAFSLLELHRRQKIEKVPTSLRRLCAESVPESERLKKFFLVLAEMVATRQPQLGIQLFEEQYLGTLSQSPTRSKSLDARISMLVVDCYAQAGQYKKARAQLAVVRRTGSVSAVTLNRYSAWIELQAGEISESLKIYQRLLSAHDVDGPGLSDGIGQQARLEMALCLLVVGRAKLAGEWVERAVDQNPELDLTVFRRNNQKYAEQLAQIQAILDGVKDGGSLTLGRNQTQKSAD